MRGARGSATPGTSVARRCPRGGREQRRPVVGTVPLGADSVLLALWEDRQRVEESSGRGRHEVRFAPWPLPLGAALSH